MKQNGPLPSARSLRLLIAGLAAVLLVAGIALIAALIGNAVSPLEEPQVNALAQSNDSCVTCHRDATVGIVEQFGQSVMAAAGVRCRDCHEVKADHAGSVAHEGTYVLPSPSSGRCARCHGKQVVEFNSSRHGLPAYVAMTGTEPLSDAQLATYEAIPEGSFAPDKERNAIFALEGPTVTRFACEVCHNIGKPSADGSIGRCQSCHLRHTFSLEQVRKPETCNACHIGPDHPQWEIYQESPHGIAYATGGDRWNWTAAPGTLDVTDMPAATCATCHISGFGGAASTHDVGDRLTWYLFSAISQRRPDWEANRARMQSVCQACHNQVFIDELYSSGDALVLTINGWVEESNAVIAPLQQAGLLTAAPFDEPIDFTYFNLWHHWGRTAKFGAWMQGPDYVQWHGAYELLADLAELRHMVDEKLRRGSAGE